MDATATAPARHTDQPSLEGISERTLRALLNGTVTVSEDGVLWDGLALPARIQRAEHDAVHALIADEWLLVDPLEDWATSSTVRVSADLLEVVVAELDGGQA